MDFDLSNRVDLGPLEQMAHDMASIMRERPQDIFDLGERLMGALVTPMFREANHRLGYWVCRVMPSRCLGCSVQGEKDVIVGENSAMFYGVFSDIDILDIPDTDQLHQQAVTGPVPSLIFETIDDEVPAGIAQSYLHVAVPLLDTFVDIERVAIAEH